jgi:hypothetical protein
MPDIAQRPAEGATAPLAREPGKPADSETAFDLADALLEVRAARERLRRVDSLLSRMLVEIQQRLEPQTCREPGNTPAARLPHSKTLDNRNTTKLDAGLCPNPGHREHLPLSGEVSCPL